MTKEATIRYATQILMDRGSLYTVYNGQVTLNYNNRTMDLLDTLYEKGVAENSYFPASKLADMFDKVMEDRKRKAEQEAKKAKKAALAKTNRQRMSATI